MDADPAADAHATAKTAARAAARSMILGTAAIGSLSVFSLHLLPALASFGGDLVAARLSRRVGARRMMGAGLAGSLLAVLIIATLITARVWVPLALLFYLLLRRGRSGHSPST